MTIKLTVELVDLSWADLYGFVDMARSAGVPADQAVEQVFLEQDDSILDSLRVELPPLDGGAPRSFTLSADERAEFIDALGRVLDSDGDARAALDELKRLRDRLLSA